MKLLASPLLLITLFLSISVHASDDFFTDISNAYLPGEVKELLAGELTIPVIELEAHTPLPLGTAVLLTESFPSSLTLAQGSTLAQILSEKGWNVVLSPFNLPIKDAIDADAQGISTSTNSSATNSPTDNLATTTPEQQTTTKIHPRSNQLTQYLDFDATSAQLSLQLNALNNYLQERQGYRMVIAQGMLAATYLSVTKDQETLHPDTFVAISPFWPDTYVNDLIIDNIAQAEFPLLDLSLEGFNDWTQDTLNRRRISAQNALKIHYRQIIIPTHALAISANQSQKPPHIQLVANNTIGWTRYLGW